MEEYFIDEFGVHFSKDRQKLIWCPSDFKGEYRIPSGVLSIESGAFTRCEGLLSLKIPSGVTSIGFDALWGGCTGLTSIEIPSSINMIGDNAIEGCTNLTSIVVDKDNPKFDSRNDCNAIIETKTNTFLFGCCNTKIPPSVKKIGRDSFFKCTSLKSIKIPHRITSIASGVF